MNSEVLRLELTVTTKNQILISRKKIVSVNFLYVKEQYTILPFQVQKGVLLALAVHP